MCGKNHVTEEVKAITKSEPISTNSLKGHVERYGEEHPDWHKNCSWSFRSRSVKGISRARCARSHREVPYPFLFDLEKNAHILVLSHHLGDTVGLSSFLKIFYNV